VSFGVDQGDFIRNSKAAYFLKNIGQWKRQEMMKELKQEEFILLKEKLMSGRSK
jgi:hypothetical protein